MLPNVTERKAELPLPVCGGSLPCRDKSPKRCKPCGLWLAYSTPSRYAQIKQDQNWDPGSWMDDTSIKVLLRATERVSDEYAQGDPAPPHRG
jgi:hypothetical protein